MSKAIVLGATGLVGGHLWQLLKRSSQYQAVQQLGRQANNSQPDDFTKIDYDQLAKSSRDFACDDLFCCLGTTIKKAGTQDNFKRVDYEYVVNACTLARANGAKRLLVISSIGADAQAKAFYFRVKGEMEQAVSALGFEQVHIFRPSLLLGERTESRPLEQLSGPLLRMLSAVMVGPLKKFKPVEASYVANQMLQQAVRGVSSSRSVHIHTVTG